MSEQSTSGYLDMDLLRFTTAGSVDDGKSTLIGRLLYLRPKENKELLLMLPTDTLLHRSVNLLSLIHQGTSSTHETW